MGPSGERGLTDCVVLGGRACMRWSCAVLCRACPYAYFSPQPPLWQINEIEQVPPNATIDLLGVVKAFTPESTITTKKDGREVSKRELTIADDSGTEVRLTLWGEKATQDPAQWEGHPIVAFKGVKVSDFNGRSLGSLPSTQMQVQPDLPEAAALHNWCGLLDTFWLFDWLAHSKRV